ncbi:MAG: ParA family protein [Methylococcales bacterium]|nr:ParA family protein [Methylococcales bacterium]
MRNFGVKSKLAKEFVGFMGGSPEFRALFEKKNQQYHNTYSALDIRNARLKLSGIDPSSLQPEIKIPPIINCRMAKGGTGKTTICGGVASALSMFGYKVLMIDGDPQASLTGLFGINWATENITHIGELMLKHSRKGRYSIEEAVRPLYENNMLDLIASDISLANADSWLMGVTNREFSFRRFLDANIEFFSKYDVIMIDSAPSTNLLTNSFMCACQKILAVVWLDGQSLKAMQVLASNVNELNDAFNSVGFHLDVHIVANGYHPSYGPCKDAMSTLISSYPDKLNNNVIPHAASFMRQVELFKVEDSGTVLEREPNSIAARSIIDLTKSLVKEYDIKLCGNKLI